MAVFLQTVVERKNEASLLSNVTNAATITLKWYQMLVWRPACNAVFASMLKFAVQVVVRRITVEAVHCVFDLS